MSTDRELLEMAAKAAGMAVLASPWPKDPDGWFWCKHGSRGAGLYHSTNRAAFWNPLTDDGDEARLEAVLRLNVTWHPDFVEVRCDRTSAACCAYFLPGIEPQAARREAGVRVAAEIGRATP